MPPKKKRKARPKTIPTPARLKFLTAALVVLLIAGIAAVKYFQTDGGRVALLDAGFHMYYAQVQETTGDALKQSIGAFGLRRNINEKAAFTRVDGRTFRTLSWDIPCPESTDFVSINVALSKAVKKTGASVRRSEERDDGRTLIFHVGSKKFDTHRITLRQSKRVAQVTTRLPMVAVVIDDYGYARGGVSEQLIELDLPLTIAIIPTLKHSAYALKRAKALGRCTLLHLPMEAGEGGPTDVDPVTTSMGEREIEAMVERYVKSLPGIDGVNNHQGSRATADERVMRTVLKVLESRGLFFLDSLTSSKSVAYNTARELGLPAARNSVFLDADTEDSAVVESRLRKLVEMAKRQGSAVGIGHPRQWTLDALRDNEAFLKNSGVELVYVSELLSK